MNLNSKISKRLAIGIGTAAIALPAGLLVATSGSADPSDTVQVTPLPALKSQLPAPANGVALLKDIAAASVQSSVRPDLTISNTVGVDTPGGRVTVGTARDDKGTAYDCFVDATGSGGCNPSASASEDYLPGSVTAIDGQFEVTIVVPASVTNVAVVGTDGTSRPLVTKDGVATGRFDREQIARLTWTRADGSAGSSDLAVP